MARNFMQLLQARWDEGKFVCVGLDSATAKLPNHLQDERYAPYSAQRVFNYAIIQATSDFVCAYKPNLAFYRGASGKHALRDTIAHIHDSAPGVPVILDAKQADIGSTNDEYVAEDFDWYGADAVTVHPYLGMEAMKSFLDQKDKGVIVLARTSNPGAGEFQDRIVRPTKNEIEAWDLPRPYKYTGFDEDSEFYPEMPLYQLVAYRVSREWNYNGNCAVVAGATYPDELAQIRKIVGDMAILIPGIGTQGGDLEATVRAGANARKQGMIINGGSAVIFASKGEDFAGVARAATLDLHNNITAVLAAM